MAWDVRFDDDFKEWLLGLDRHVQLEIFAFVERIEEFGPRLGRPYVDTLKGSAFTNMKEARIQIKGKPWRIFFAFDPNRTAIFLTGGCKTDASRWYNAHIRIADERFRRHLKGLDK